MIYERVRTENEFVKVILMGLLDLFKRKRNKKKTKKMFIPKHDDICIMGGWIFGESIFMVDEVLNPDAYDDEELIVQCKYVASQIITPYKTESLFTLSTDEKLNIDCDFRRSIRLADDSTREFLLNGIEEYQKWHTNE